MTVALVLLPQSSIVTYTLLRVVLGCVPQAVVNSTYVFLAFLFRAVHAYIETMGYSLTQRKTSRERYCYLFSDARGTNIYTD